MPRKTAPPIIRVPRRSRRCRRPNDSDTANHRSGPATTATGTFSQKIACQLTPSTTAPPITGPSATPRPDTPPQMPMAMGRMATGTDAASRVSDNGITAAAPMPWTVRARISAPDEVLRADAIEATVNRVSPASITRRRPQRSPSVAAGSMNVANASVYALTNQARSSTDAARSVRITGSAEVITRLSSVAMNIGSEVARTASHTGTTRRGPATGLRVDGQRRRGGERDHDNSKKASNDYLDPDSK